MSALIRRFDWASTDLGPPSAWPPVLLHSVNLMLQSPTPLLILWGETGITLYNDAYRDFAGNRHPALLGAPCASIWTENQELVEEILRQAFAGSSLSYRRRHIRIDRGQGLEDIWLDYSCSPLFDSTGNPAGVFIVVEETTATVLAEKALQASEERLKLVIEGSNDGIWDYDLKTRISFWNDRMYEILGYPKEAVRRPGFDFLQSIMHPEDRARVQAAFILAATEGRLYDMEYRVKHGNGQYMHLHVKGIPVFDEQGQLQRMAGTATDITERKLAEQALRESEERFSGIFNQASVGVAEVDLTGKFVLVNQRFCQLVGRSREELYQMRMQDISHQEDLPANLSLFQRAIREGLPFTIEKRYLRPDSSEVWVSNNVSVVRDNTGAPRYLVAISQDITERKQAEKHQQLFLALCETSSDFIGLATPEGKPFYLNPAGRRMVGLKDLDAVKATQVIDFFIAEDQPFVREVILPTQWEKGLWSGEYRFRNFQTGETLAVHYTQFLVKNPESGEVLAIAAVAQDITTRKKVEEALQESEERYRTMAEAAGILIAHTDEAGNAIYFNQEWLKLTGRTMEGLLNFGWVDLLHPDDRDSLIQDYQEALSQKKTLKRPFRLRSQAGEYRWELAVVTPRFSPNGTFVGFISSCVDITEHKLAEEELKKFKLLSDYAFDAFILMREDGSFAYLNDLAMKRWGYTADEIKRLRVPDVDPIYQEEKFNEVFALAQEQGALPPFETLHKRKDGTIFPVEVSMGGITLDGKPHMFAVARDISERKQAEETLKARNELLLRTNNDLDNFIYTASHDLKTPILNIEGLVNVLVHDLPAEIVAEAEINKILSMIRHAITRFRSTINDLTEISKLQKQTEEDVTEVYLPDLFEEVRLDLELNIRATNAQLEVDFSSCSAVKYSRRHLRSILYNLLSNAIKYHSPDRTPRVQVRTERESGQCILTVSDNGLGMDLKRETRLFTMFKRLHNHVEGSGVGLYIVKKIVENSGGSITVESDLGKGSTFRVFLPCR